MADFIPLAKTVRRIQIPSDQIADPSNSLVDQAQYHGWLLRSITGISIGIPERGPEPLKGFEGMGVVNRATLRNLLSKMIAINAPIALHWQEAAGSGPMQAAQTKTSMDALLRLGAHYAHKQGLYDLIMEYGRAGYISPNQSTNGVKSLEDALRSRNHTTTRALVELGACPSGIPHQDSRPANGTSCPAGDFDYFMEHWVGSGAAIAQTYYAARMNRDIQEQADQAALVLAAQRETTIHALKSTDAVMPRNPSPPPRRRGI